MFGEHNAVAPESAMDASSSEASAASASDSGARALPSYFDAGLTSFPSSLEQRDEASLVVVVRENHAAYQCSIAGADRDESLFAHVRIESTADGYVLAAQRTCDQGYCKPFETSRTLKEAEWTAIVRAFEARQFDSLAPSGRSGLDGAT